MHKMPRIWLDYARFLSMQGLITRTRKVYDRALQSLPVTQHGMIWQFYLQWAISLSETHPYTAKAAYERYLELRPEKSLEYL
jgi:pre-mRNA-splicing factor SYF1